MIVVSRNVSHSKTTTELALWDAETVLF